MSRRLERWRGARASASPEVVLCRGGDCGSRRKHPGTDHAGQLDRIRAAVAPDRAVVTVSRCLDACEHSNVVVLVPGTRAREAGERPTWFGEVLDDRATDAVLRRVPVDAAEAAPGGPDAHVFEPGAGSAAALGARRSRRRRG